MNAVVDATLDAAFERADQLYKNWSRVCAGLIALLAALAVWYMSGASRANFGTAFLIGLLAVPLAPIAKDITSALSTAAQAFKAARRP
ncbi:MAG: hypothetical protein JWN66_1663 [Sphingomonas bacterium]|nr:hypothetical protein [Sphingomonas bacterium]